MAAPAGAAILVLRSSSSTSACIVSIARMGDARDPSWLFRVIWHRDRNVNCVQKGRASLLIPSTICTGKRGIHSQHFSPTTYSVEGLFPCVFVCIIRSAITQTNLARDLNVPARAKSKWHAGSHSPIAGMPHYPRNSARPALQALLIVRPDDAARIRACSSP